MKTAVGAGLIRAASAIADVPYLEIQTADELVWMALGESSRKCGHEQRLLAMCLAAEIFENDEPVHILSRNGYAADWLGTALYADYYGDIQ